MGPGLFAFGETRRVLERVDGGAPNHDARALALVIECFEVVFGVVDELLDALVDPLGDLGPCVDPPEAELRVRAHLGRLAELGHEPFAERDHDRVVLGELARRVPERLAHGIGRDRVRVFLDLVERGFVEPFSFAVAAVELGSESGDGRRHRDERFHARREKREPGLGLPAALLAKLHVLEPEMKTPQDRARVEGPLGDEISLESLLFRQCHPSLEGELYQLRDLTEKTRAPNLLALNYMTLGSRR